MSEPGTSDSTGIPNQPDNTAVWLAGVLAEAGVRAALIGGQAVNTWSQPRGTNDYDFCVDANREAIERAESRLVDEGFAYLTRLDGDEPSGPDFVRMKNSSRAIIVDLQTAKTDYQAGVIKRAAVSDRGVRIALPEDLIVLKLLAMRSQDQRDIAKLMNWNDLDWPYIEHWAGIWQVTDKLAVFRDGRFD